MFEFFKNLLHGVNLKTRPGAEFRMRRVEYETLDEHFARDQQGLDEKMPGWSEPGRVANAKLRLSRGMAPDDVGLIFGEATLRQAQRELSQAGMMRMSGEFSQRIRVAGETDASPADYEYSAGHKASS